MFLYSTEGASYQVADVCPGISSLFPALKLRQQTAEIHTARGGDRGYKKLLSQVSGQNDKYVVSMLSSVVAICCFELSLRNKIIKAAENICCCAVPTISGLCCINDL